MLEVELNLMLADRAGIKRTSLDADGGIGLSQLTERLGFSEKDVGMLMINKKWAPLESVMHNGDFVQLFPLVEGG